MTAIAISAVTLAVATFELSMADWPSGFVLLGVLPLAALLFCGCALWSATLLLRIRNGGAKFALPFLIYALTLAVLVYAPLQQIALQQNFYWHRQDRERIVARVEAGELKPNVGYNKNLIALGDREPNVSAGGNDIVVDETGRRHLCAVPDLPRPEALFHRLPARAVRAAIPRTSSSSRTSRRAGSSAMTRTGTSWRIKLGPLKPAPCADAARLPARHAPAYRESRTRFRIKQAIELGAACFHARGELGLGNLLPPHQFVKLPHQHALDSPRGYAFVRFRPPSGNHRRTIQLCPSC